MSRDDNTRDLQVGADEIDTDAEESVDLSAIPDESEIEETRNETDPAREMEERIMKLEEENSSLKDQYLRKQADYENFRKRMFREKDEAIKYANSVLLMDIVSIIDDFERAIKSSENSKDFDSFHSGIELIEKQFTGMLERKWGLTRFESEGEPFDPEKHEAIAMEDSEKPTQIVLEDYQKGYMLYDRVLRHAKVKVSSPVQTEPSESENDSIDETKEEKE